MTPMKNMVAAALVSPFVLHTRSNWRETNMWRTFSHITDHTQKIPNITCETKVDLNLLESYTHPLWHGTTGSSVVFVLFVRRDNWSCENMWQELKVPSSCFGMLTVSLSSGVIVSKTPEESRQLMLQWWDGVAAMKLFSRNWPGRVMRGSTISTKSTTW